MPFFLMIVLQMFLVMLKVTHTVDWSWHIIFTPVYAGLVWLVIFAFLLVRLVGQIQTQRRAFR
jgi:hypothetical protein